MSLPNDRVPSSAITVKQLIKRLEHCDPDSYVGAYNPVFNETVYITDTLPRQEPTFVEFKWEEES